MIRFLIPAALAIAPPPSHPIHEPPAATQPATQPTSMTFDFDQDAIGTIPAGWKIDATNPAEPPATWQVIQDAAAPSGTNVLTISSSRHHSSGTFNLCWTDRVTFSDGEIEVSFKPLSGAEDQGGGPIWRVHDRNNYYVARANPLEKNFRLYHVKDGVRTMIATADANCSVNEWHTIKVNHRGDHITCWLDGRKLIDATDDTISVPGGIGLWSKADALTSFDHVVVHIGDTK